MDELINLIFYMVQPTIWLFLLVVIFLWKAVKFVPQNRTFLIERFGKFRTVQEAGLNFLVPFIDRSAADRSLKEQAVHVHSQGAITQDNI